MNELSVRNDHLYGPGKKNSNAAIKHQLEKDNVLKKDECQVKEPWETTNLACFGKKTVKLDRETARLSTEIQRTSNFEFGSDSNKPLTATTCFEFCKKVLPPVKCDEPALYTTNIPDFSPLYTKSKTIGDEGSVYSTSYYSAEDCPKAIAKSQTQLRGQTENMQITHFNLGSDWQRNCSETVHSYHSRNISNVPNGISSSNATSCVFRHGDWNMTRPSMTTTSLTHDHFSRNKDKPLVSSFSKCQKAVQPKEYSSQIGQADVCPQHSTAIKLGSDKAVTSSLYQKDFLKYDMSECPLKPSKSNRPKSSKVLLQTVGMVFPKSTKESDFEYHHDESVNFAKNRMKEFVRNQGRHKVSCVALTDDEQDKKYMKQVSMTSKDYQKPSNEFIRSRKLHRRQDSSYDYILLDKGLVDQPEYCIARRRGKRRQFVPSNARSLHSNEECEDRLKQSQQTHFSLGLDRSNTVHSEQHDQFTMKVPLDPLYPAAGSKTLRVERNAHLYARDDITPGDSIGQPSVMKSDYQPILKQRLSSAQRRLVTLDLKYPPKIAPSHYFHLDPSSGRKKSTTANDYIAPELMPGQ